MTRENKIDLVIDELKKANCDEGSIVFNNIEKTEVYYESQKISMVRTVFQDSATIFYKKGNKSASINLNQTKEDDLKKAIEDVRDLAKESGEDEFKSIPEHSEVKSFKSGLEEHDLDKMYDRLNELINDIKKDYPMIKIDSAGINFNKINKFLKTTKGAYLKEESGSYSYSMMFAAGDKDKTSSFNYFGGELENLDKRLIEGDLVRTILEETQKTMDAESVEGKIEGDIVLAPSIVGEFLYYLSANYLMDSSIYTNTSIWKDKLGQKVADEKLTFTLEPLSFPAGSKISGDGYINENLTVIENGVLKNFILSQYGAKRSGKERSNTTDFNIIVKEGDKSLEELIKDMKKGILLNRFSGGAPSSSGDFAGVIKNSFLIEDGKITKPISEVMVAGNLGEIFNNIVGLTKQTFTDGSTRLPYIRTSGLKASGK